MLIRLRYILLTQENIELKTKKIILFVSLSFFMSCLTGCTTKSWYEGGQIGAKQNCHNKPLNQREQCLKNLNKKTYEEYEKH